MTIQDYINNPESITKLNTRIPLEYVYEFTPNTTEDIHVWLIREDQLEDFEVSLTKHLDNEVLFFEKPAQKVHAKFEKVEVDSKDNPFKYTLKLSLFDYEPSLKDYALRTK